MGATTPKWSGGGEVVVSAAPWRQCCNSPALIVQRHADNSVHAASHACQESRAVRPEPKSRSTHRGMAQVASPQWLTVWPLLTEGRVAAAPFVPPQGGGGPVGSGGDTPAWIPPVWPEGVGILHYPRLELGVSRSVPFGISLKGAESWLLLREIAVNLIKVGQHEKAMARSNSFATLLLT